MVANLAIGGSTCCLLILPLVLVMLLGLLVLQFYHNSYLTTKQIITSYALQVSTPSAIGDTPILQLAFNPTQKISIRLIFIEELQLQYLAI